MTTGQALKMKVELAALMRRHGITQVPYSLPLAPATPCPMTLSGFASTNDIDAERMRFRGFAFGLLRPSCVQLLFKHDSSQPAGVVEKLSYDPYGRLQIECRVDHELGRRLGAFSVGCRIRSYAIHRADSADFYAEIEDAALEEVSLTDCPSNPRALVRSRFPVGPHVAVFENFERYVGALKMLVSVLPALSEAISPAPTAGAIVRKDVRAFPKRGDNMVGQAIWSNCFPQRPPAPRRARSSFSELAEHLRNQEA